jgi:hypothetical protein
MGRRVKKSRAGRPPLFDERMNRVNVMLSDDDVDRTNKIGEGNVSHGIRLALERTARELERTKKTRKRKDE